MIVFLSIFLGLVHGVQWVELAVEEPVVRVELFLGERRLAVLEEAPWRARCDFGSTLHPAELAAVGYDASGKQCYRAVQRLNMPQQRAAIALVPELDEQRRVVAAQLSWESPEFGKPKAMRAQLNQEKLRVPRSGRIDLSQVDHDMLHVLTVEVDFPDGVALRRELVFGAGYSGEASRALTAVPVALTGAEEPTVEGLQGALQRGPRALEVVAVEEPETQLIVIRDWAIDDRLERLEEDRDERQERRRNSQRSRDRTARDGFDEEVAVRLMIPTVSQVAGGRHNAMLFPMSEVKSTQRKGLLHLLARARYGEGVLGGRRAADAVAVAGMRAAAGNRRRAVVFALGPDEQDLSVHRIPSVHAYLKDLGVPLFVWGFGASEPELKKWAAEDLRDYRGLRGAVRQVRDELSAQRIVWVEGYHLPQEISLSDHARGIRLVGRD